jgi:hypothetical protein
MAVARWIGAGLVGGLIGAVIWGVVAYYAQYEFGWIAWGVGALVGVSVRLAGGGEEGAASGLTAVTIALLAVVAGKYIAVAMVVSAMGKDIRVTPEDMIRATAKDVAREWEAEGKRLLWPGGKGPQDAREKADFPDGVWEAATRRWLLLDPDEQQRQIQQRKTDLQAFFALHEAEVRSRAFRASFDVLGVVWLLLASVSAYRIASGQVFRQS